MDLRKLKRVVYYTSRKTRPKTSEIVFKTREAAVPNQPNVKYLNKMLNVSILNKTERDMYKEMAEYFAEKEGSIYETLQVVPSKYGRGVVSTIDIKENQYIGSFYGRLCRELPDNAIYSFKISIAGEKPLYVDAENEKKRPILAYCNHECFFFNATAYLTGTELGVPKIDFIARGAIRAGTEITIHYSDDYFDNTLRCRCTSCPVEE